MIVSPPKLPPDASGPGDVRAETADTSLLARIRARLPELRRSERQVAEAVLQQPNDVLNQSANELAERVGVSQPTVVRFSTAMGFSGYREFKLRLAQSLAAGVPFVHQDVQPGDSTDTIAAKVFDRAIGALISVRSHLDTVAIEQAAQLLSDANRIEFYGVGNSGIVAMDAQHKFFRYGMPTAHYLDTHTMVMASSLVSTGDVVVAISATGRSVEVVRACEIARESGASVIAITASDTPLSALADITLGVDVAEDADVYAPMISRQAHLAVIDALSVCVALKLGPDLASTLERTKRLIREKRIARRYV